MKSLFAYMTLSFKKGKGKRGKGKGKRGEREGEGGGRGRREEKRGERRGGGGGGRREEKRGLSRYITSQVKLFAVANPFRILHTGFNLRNFHFQL